MFGLQNVGNATLCRLPPFYRAVLTAWYSVGGSHAFGALTVPHPRTDPIPLADVTVHCMYATLGHINYKPHRCIAKTRELGFGHIEWRAVWKNLNLLRYSQPALDTSWLIAHCILPTADRLLHFGMDVNPSCHCNVPETLVHLFVECPFATPLLDWFTNLLRSHNPSSTRPTTTDILWTYPKPAAPPAGFLALLAIICHQIWIARNSHRFDGFQPEPQISLKRTVILSFPLMGATVPLSHIHL